MTFARAAGGGFLLAGALELAFACFSLLGSAAGALIAYVGSTGALRPEDHYIGPLMGAVYAFFLAVSAVAAGLHLAAGVSLLSAHPRRTLVLVATVGSCLPLATFYCAPTSMVAGCLGLAWLVASHRPDASGP